MPQIGHNQFMPKPHSDETQTQRKGAFSVSYEPCRRIRLRKPL